jgi:hypothetical protein
MRSRHAAFWATRPARLPMNDVGWRRATFNMILRGAQIGPNDFEAAVNYLTANFGPGVATSRRPM